MSMAQQGEHRIQFFSVSDECVVKVPASEAWKLYGTIDTYIKLVMQFHPDILSKFDLVQGDGSAGTIVQPHFYPAPGTDVGITFKEKYTVVDDEKRVKEAEVVEGGLLDLGLTLYRVRYEIIEKEGVEDECITKATVEYEAEATNIETAANFVLGTIQSLSTFMERVADHLLHNYKKQLI